MIHPPTSQSSLLWMLSNCPISNIFNTQILIALHDTPYFRQKF